jgi:hypothetical protein
MTRIMRDSTMPKAIPIHGTDLVAGYVNGKYAWGPEGFARFPGIPHVRIDVFASSPEHAGVLDVEPGCSTVEQAVIWAKQRKSAHPNWYQPIIYCDRGHLTPLFNAMNAAGLKVVRDFRLWIATLDGTKRVADMTGVTAVQYKRAPREHKDGSPAEPPSASVTAGHYDESLVYDDNWHRPAPG